MNDLGPRPDRAPGGAALGQLKTWAAAELDSLNLQGPKQESQELLVWELPRQSGPFPPQPSPHTCLPRGLREGKPNPIRIFLAQRLSPKYQHI